MLSIYELSDTLTYVNHYWAEVNDYTFGSFKRIVTGGEDVYYLGYNTWIFAPYSNYRSGVRMKLNNSFLSEICILFEY